jgi:hypothetical protein
MNLDFLKDFSPHSYIIKSLSHKSENTLGLQLFAGTNFSELI